MATPSLFPVFLKAQSGGGGPVTDTQLLGGVVTIEQPPQVKTAGAAQVATSRAGTVRTPAAGKISTPGAVTVTTPAAPKVTRCPE